MFIDISAVTKLIGTNMDLVFSIEEKDLKERISVPEQLMNYSSPLSFKGNVQNVDGSIKLAGLVDFKYTCLCDKCGIQLEHEMSYSIEEELMNEEKVEGEEAEEMYSYKGGNLDMMKIISDSVSLNLPMRSLCNKECKGICYHCGKDLNQEECECEKGLIDSRLEALKDFYK